MTPPPLVSVVTPMYQGAGHVAEAVASVREQSVGALEHVVVDDGSTDDGREVMAELLRHDRRLRFLQQPNAGLSAARNAGWAACDPRSPFLLFLDHDDVLRPGALEALVDALGRAPASPAAHGRTAAVDGWGREVGLVRSEASVRREVERPERWVALPSRVRRLCDDEPTTFASIAYVLHVYTAGQVLIRRTALEAVGGFERRLRLAQDYDMWLRLAALGPLAFVPRVLLDYRQVAGSMSSDASLTRHEDLVCRFVAMTSPSVPAVVRATARHAHRQHEWHRAADRLRLVRGAAGRGSGPLARELARAGRSIAEAVLASTAATAHLRARSDGAVRAIVAERGRAA